jgi:sugar transferase (PEP-CTERM/EpsH1 system associated)
MHVVNNLGRGGMEFGVLKVIEGLGHKLFEHRLCATRASDAEFVRTFDLGDILSVAGSARSGLQFPLFRLRKIFRQYRPHIVHTRNWGGLEAIPAARLAGVPVVIHSEHGYEVEQLGGLPRRQRIFRRMAYAMADSVFTVTRELRNFHSAQAWVNPERIRVIHNGVNTQRFAPSAETQDRVRGELEVAADAVLIGSVGRMVPIKDYGTLLSAMIRLVERGMNLQALLVGDGPKLESLKREASESPALRGRVKFTGASDRVPELLNAMDIFVLSSLREGMSNTLLEAMSCGLPIVASRAGGNEETISDGQSGFLFDAGDDQALAERIERLVVNAELRRAMSEAARNRALAEFSLDTMIERYRGLYLDAAAHRGIRASLR